MTRSLAQTVFELLSGLFTDLLLVKALRLDLIEFGPTLTCVALRIGATRGQRACKLVIFLGKKFDICAF